MRTANYRRQVLFSLVFLCVSTLSAQAELRDYDTQRFGMHACPPPGFMTGVHIDNNVLLCDNTVVSDEQFAAAGETIDEDNQERTMHACPENMAMTGYHHDKNQLLCAKVGETFDFPDINGETQRSIGHLRMHACPVGTVMRGIYADGNDFLCGVVLRRPGEACSTNDIAIGIWDCDSQCVDADTARRWTGDGYCDDRYGYGINLACRIFDHDGGDCDNK